MHHYSQNAEVIWMHNSCYAFCAGALRLPVAIKPLEFSDVYSCSHFLLRMDAAVNIWRKLAQQFNSFAGWCNHHRHNNEVDLIAQMLVAGRLKAYKIYGRIQRVECNKQNPGTEVFAIVDPSVLIIKPVIKVFAFNSAREIDAQLAVLSLTPEHVQLLKHSFTSPQRFASLQRSFTSQQPSLTSQPVLASDDKKWLHERLLKQELLLVTVNGAMREQQCDRAHFEAAKPADSPHSLAWAPTAAPAQRNVKPQEITPAIPINAHAEQLQHAAKHGTAICEACVPMASNQPLSIATTDLPVQAETLARAQSIRQAQIKTIQLAARSGAAVCGLCDQAAAT